METSELLLEKREQVKVIACSVRGIGRMRCPLAL
jgi:hypothetical protein